MSMEEDTELRDLVVKSLEANGILSNLKAQLRASVFLALEEENSIKDKIPLRNTLLHEFLQTNNGKLLFILISEVLEYFNLEFTKSVLEAEANLNEILQTDINTLTKDFNKIEKLNKKQPLLFDIILNAQQSCHLFTSVNNNTSANNNTFEQSSSSDSAPKPITEIRTTVKSINNQTFIKLNDADTVSQSSDVSFESNEASIPQEHATRTSSIVEECIGSVSVGGDTISNEEFLIDFDKSIQQTSSPYVKEEITIERNLLDETLQGVKDGVMTTSSTELPVLAEKNDRSDKVKSFSSLSSLQDLPPLNLNKNRTEALLLPSLYTKKEKKTNSDLLNEEDSINE